MAEQEITYNNKLELGRTFLSIYDYRDEKEALTKKMKELLQLALVCVYNCPHCKEDHIKRAFEAGATKQEVSETLFIAAMENHEKKGH